MRDERTLLNLRRLVRQFAPAHYVFPVVRLQRRVLECPQLALRGQIVDAISRVRLVVDLHSTVSNASRPLVLQDLLLFPLLVAQLSLRLLFVVRVVPTLKR